MVEALRTGVATLTWVHDTFAYAESFDESSGRYLGIATGRQIELGPNDPGILVKAEVAQRQLNKEVSDTDPTPPEGEPHDPKLVVPDAPMALSHRRYHGSVRLDPTRVGRDASQIAQEVIAHLVGLAGADVMVTIDIEAKLPDGASDHVVRTVTENGRTLKFELGSGFERD